MTSEPLTKEKILHARILGEVGIAKVTKIEDDKSAVQWLLKEIENMKKELSPPIPITYEEGFYRCLAVVEDLIKKAFSGVLRNDTQRIR